MALIRLNNQSISSVTALPSGIDTGKVIQHKFVRAFSAANASTSNTLFELDTNLRMSITPTSTSNRIVIRYKVGWVDNLDTGRDMKLAIYRDTTNLLEDAGAADRWYRWSGDRFQGTWDAFWIDANHNTTSSVTYKLYCAGNGLGSTIGSSSRYTYGELMEIKV